MKRWAFALGVAALAQAVPAWGAPAGQASIAAQAERLSAEGPAVDFRLGGQLHKGAWKLKKEANPDLYTMGLGKGEKKEVCFISGPNSWCRTVGIGDSYDLTISHAGADYPTRVAWGSTCRRWPFSTRNTKRLTEERSGSPFRRCMNSSTWP